MSSGKFPFFPRLKVASAKDQPYAPLLLQWSFGPHPAQCFPSMRPIQDGRCIHAGLQANTNDPRGSRPREVSGCAFAGLRSFRVVSLGVHKAVRCRASKITQIPKWRTQGSTTRRVPCNVFELPRFRLPGYEATTSDEKQNTDRGREGECLLLGYGGCHSRKS